MDELRDQINQVVQGRQPYKILASKKANTEENQNYDMFFEIIFEQGL